MEASNKRIIKNSLWLYIRMIVATCVSLYTSRIVLKAIGIDDFGIYNVAGGILSFLSVLTFSMTNSIQRFLNVAKGNNNSERFLQTVKTGVSIQICIALLVLFVGETVGVYLISHVMIFPEARQFAAMFTFQASLVALIINLLILPFNAIVVTYEKFSFFAGISLFDVFAKLIVAFVLPYLRADNLIIYALSFPFISIFQLGCVLFYTRRWYSFKDYSVVNSLRCEESKHLLHFSSWSLLGNFAGVCSNHGVSLIFNSYYPLFVNAAVGVTNQVMNTLAMLNNNVQQAFRPQLIQAYCEQDKKHFFSLLYNASKWSFVLLLFVGVPFIYYIDDILQLWLDDVPQYTSQFITILFFYLCLDSFSIPMLFAIEGSGRIKNYQITVSALLGINVFMAWGCCYMHLSPSYAVFTRLFINALVLLTRVSFLKGEVRQFNVKEFLIVCVYPVMQMMALLLIYTLIWHYCLRVSPFLYILGYCLLFAGITYVLLLNTQQRSDIMATIKKTFING